MTTKQSEAWEQLVRQCKTQCLRRPYSSINVASKTRSEAIVAAGERAALVTPELANLLVLLACAPHAQRCTGTIEDVKKARKLAAQIREALDDSQA